MNGNPPASLSPEQRIMGRVAGRLLIMREDLQSLAAALNEGYREQDALECQQVLTALAAFANKYAGNFERAVWPPRSDSEGDGLQWSDVDE